LPQKRGKPVVKKLIKKSGIQLHALTDCHEAGDVHDDVPMKN
jgi:hypothetical protein